MDGVLGEGFASARLDAGAATSTGSPAAALRRMGLEERGHAELGSDIVRWCLGEHPRGCIDLKRRVKTIDFAG